LGAKAVVALTAKKFGPFAMLVKQKEGHAPSGTCQALKKFVQGGPKQAWQSKST